MFTWCAEDSNLGGNVGSKSLARSVTLQFVKIEKGCRVRIKVRLKVADGDEIEKRVLEYFQGAGTMLPGLEKVLAGLEQGARKSGVLEADKAFGDPALQIAKTMSRAEFPKDAKLAVGAQFVAKGADNQQDVILRIHKLTDAEVTVHLLHPLAEKDIEYDVEVLSVTTPARPPPLPVDAIGAQESD